MPSLYCTKEDFQKSQSKMKQQHLFSKYIALTRKDMTGIRLKNEYPLKLGWGSVI